MEYFVVALVAFLASGLTFYSGFGLGTLLLPAFAVFFSAPVAVAATAVVHLLNNGFKIFLVGRNVNWSILLRFGLPAIPSAFLGAYLLNWLGAEDSITDWNVLGYEIETTYAAFLIGIVLILFAILELQEWFGNFSVSRRYLSLGGLATGFLGGLTGQQGALRSIFLLKSKLSVSQFIATGVMIAILIDLIRIPTYFVGLFKNDFSFSSPEVRLICVGTLSAFLGAWLGAKFVKKVTIKGLRYFVSLIMLVIGCCLVLGILG